MQRLNQLWQLAGAASNAAAGLRDLTLHKQTYTFWVRDGQPLTVYLRAEKAEVRLWRWARPQVEVATRLQRSFGWRLATDQDEAGVYIAARRRRVVGGMSTALFELTVPQHAHLLLRLDDCGVYLGGVDGTLHLAPPTTDGQAGTLLLP